MKMLLPFFVFLVLVNGQFATAQSPEYIIVFLNKKTDKGELPEEEVKKIMDGHLANINRLAKEGKLIAAGPFDGGGGIFIFKSDSIEQVRAWLKTDPGVQANRWNVEVLPYFPRYGSVCTVGEPYTMVTYQFIRYTPTVTKYNINQLPQIFKKHHDYLMALRNSANVITEAIFSDSDGGILVIEGELGQEAIEKDPAVTEGLLDADVKKLWIAQGAFCEK
jgi:uncharacterized protein YciI